MYEIKPSPRFKKDMKLISRRGYDTQLITNVIKTLANGGTLDAKHRDHPLSGNFVGFRECHITPDWLLIYKIKDKELLLLLSRTGTHSDLFG